MHRKNRTHLSLRLLIATCIALGIGLLGCQNREAREEVEAAEEIAWLFDLNKAQNMSREQGKPLMIDFTATWCPPCQKMEDSTFSHADVVQKSGAFVPLRIDVDEHQDIAQTFNGNARKYGGVGIPNILFMTGQGKKLKHIVGYRGPQELAAVMDSVLTLVE